MAATDRNVLRLGAYEIFHGQTPPRAAIDEAVGLARRFGSAQSAPFVNGILDNLMHSEGGRLGGRKDQDQAARAQRSRCIAAPSAPAGPFLTPHPSSLILPWVYSTN